MTEVPKTTLRRLLTCIDLTSLQDDQADDIQALCRQAVTPHGTVAAVCSWPRHVAAMAAALPAPPPKIAAVINFPLGDDDPATACAEARAATAAGANELDLVIPYKRWRAGEPKPTGEMVAAVRDTAPGATLKVILETGAFGDDLQGIAGISEAAVAAGADMLKTSTGKIEQGASLPAARTMLEVIRNAARPVGFKASGGIRSIEDAAAYLSLAEEIMGDGWATPVRFRIGASKLLDALLAGLDKDAP